MSDFEVRVPDLGDFEEVEVIDVLVSEGDTVEVEQGLVTLETDKAAMDVPSPQGGRVKSVEVSTGAKVSTGDLIAVLDVGEQEGGGDEGGEGRESRETEAGSSEADEGEAREAEADRSEADEGDAREAEADRSEADEGDADRDEADEGEARERATEKPAASGERAKAERAGGGRLVVLGAGPGGYTAAFRAADLGLDVTLVERWPALGGVCLNVGCIPSKALLHAARVVEEAAEMAEHGIELGKAKIDTDKLRGWKNDIVKKMSGGLEQLAKQRKVRIVRGSGRFVSANEIEVEHEGDTTRLEFDQCIIAAGSEPVMLPDLPDDPRIMDSTDALELEELPKRMLVVGGGIIGLEMAAVYDSLGVNVSVVELTNTLIPGCDRDLVRPLEKRIGARYEAIMLGTKVAAVEAQKSGIKVTFEGENAPEKPQRYGRVLVAVGRRPNGGAIEAEAAGVDVDERGFIGVDKQMRTNVPHIFAIGDIVGQPMLAHKATHEGKVAAEVAAGEKSHFDARCVPAVAYTDPEVAWAGLTEQQAKAEGVDYTKGSFPWSASGRAMSLGRTDGFTKLLFDAGDGRLIGVGIVGVNAGDLIAEAALAIEMGCDAEDIGLTVHPHPTLSETLAFSAEAAAGTITDLYIPGR